MESGEVRNHQQRGSGNFPLQWGNRKRLRCAKMQVKDDGKEKITVRVDRRVVRADKESNLLRRPSPHCVLRNSEAAGGTMKGQINGGAEAKDSDEAGQDKKLSSPGTDATVVLPKFTMGLTNKEKEEDFMAIKGSRLPQRPKKRAKFIQRTLNLVSPGLWLCDLTIERYEVREKKITKKRPRGLKAMGNMESGDSE